MMDPRREEPDRAVTEGEVGPAGVARYRTRPRIGPGSFSRVGRTGALIGVPVLRRVARVPDIQTQVAGP